MNQVRSFRLPTGEMESDGEKRNISIETSLKSVRDFFLVTKHDEIEQEGGKSGQVLISDVTIRSL